MLTILAVDVAITTGTMSSFWITFVTRHTEGEEIWRLPFVFLVIR